MDRNIFVTVWTFEYNLDCSVGNKRGTETKMYLSKKDGTMTKHLKQLVDGFKQYERVCIERGNSMLQTLTVYHINGSHSVDISDRLEEYSG